MKMEFNLVTIIVLVAAIAATIGLFKLKSSDNWQKIQAELEFIEVERVSTYNQTSDRDVSEYLVKLKYNYQVQGKQFIGDQVYAGVGNAFSKSSDAEQILNEYQNQQQIAVYYDPTKPESSALKQANLSMSALVWLLGFIWGVSALIIFIYNKFFAH